MPFAADMGRAPLRHSFMPLYSPGLWLAVTFMPPSQGCEPMAQYAIGVSASPIASTSEPASRMPSITAPAISGELVRTRKAELGVSFDGDADRCCFVDETGRTVGNDLMTALLACDVLKKHPRAPIVYDLRSSWVVKEEIAKHGGLPIRDRVGHSFIKATMRERKAVFGGELSGHFYFADNFTCDSGMLAMISALNLIAGEKRRFSELVAGLRRYHSTGEINFHVEDKAAAIAGLKKKYADGRQDELDGITVEFGELGGREWWWFNVRPSNTEPLLRLNLEASSVNLRDRRRDEIVSALGEPEA